MQEVLLASCGLWLAAHCAQNVFACLQWLASQMGTYCPDAQAQ